MHVLVRPLTDADHDALKGQPPRHLADLTVGDRRVWITRYPGHPDPLVSVWAPAAFVFASVHVWFAGATPASVRAWVETLPEPKVNKREARAA